MSKEYCNQTEKREKAVEKDNLTAYNESMSNKVSNQNMHHNARKEAFARKEENWNN